MKTTSFLLIFLASLLVFNSCKKDDSPPIPGGTARYMGILYEGMPATGGSIPKNRFVLLDINHADNADKQFMTVDITENAGNYKFQVAQAPRPITDYATNWPEGLRKIISGRGLSHDFLASGFMKMRTTTSYLSRPYTFMYDSTHKFMPTSSVIVPLNEMHNPIYAGAMAGKEPQAAIDFWSPGRPDPGTVPVDANDSLPDYFFYAQYYRVSKPARLYLYFNEGYYTSVISPVNQAIKFDQTILKFISQLTGKADAALSYEGTSSVLFFFDYDKWEYMTFKFNCAPAMNAGCLTDIDISPVKSMNDLMAWPAGWAQ